MCVRAQGPATLRTVLRLAASPLLLAGLLIASLVVLLFSAARRRRYAAEAARMRQEFDRCAVCGM